MSSSFARPWASGARNCVCASSEFRAAAGAQPQALGMDDAHCCFVRHPIRDRTDDEMRALADVDVAE